MYIVWWSEDIGGDDDSRRCSKSFASQEQAGFHADMLDRDPAVRDVRCSWLMTPAEIAAESHIIPF